MKDIHIEIKRDDVLFALLMIIGYNSIDILLRLSQAVTNHQNIMYTGAGVIMVSMGVSVVMYIKNKFNNNKGGIDV